MFPSKENQEKERFFFVYTIRMGNFESKNILKINGHDFVMRHDSGRFLKC